MAFVVEDRLYRDEYVYNYGRLSALGELVAGVTHNFGNVLMGVSATLELLHIKIEKQPELAESAETINKVLDRIECGAQLTQQLLEFARNTQPYITSVHPGSIVDGAMILCSTHPLAKRVTLINDVPEDAPLVRADARHLEEVIVNLVLNALQASEDGHVRIGIKNPGSDGSVDIFVSDQGCGIALEDMSDVFSQYFSKRRDGSIGNGLGLYCSLAQVEQMGGTLSVDSTLGQGSTFTVRLPIWE